MRWTLALLATLLWLARPLPSQELEGSPESAHRVVFVAGQASHGYGAHEHGAGCLMFARLLEEAAPDLESVVWLDGWPREENAFEGASTIVLFMDGGETHPLLQHLDTIDDLMKRGVGLVVLHWTLDVPDERGNATLRRWLGGSYERHWSVNPVWTARFESIPEHPVTRGITPFTQRDEWYYHMRFVDGMQGVTPLLSAHPPASTLERPDGAHSGNPSVRAAVERGEIQHVAWAYERPGGGRSVGFTGLHFHAAFASDSIRKLLLNAIAWTAERDVPARGFDTFRPSPAELAANQDFDKPPTPPRRLPPGTPSTPEAKRAAARFRSDVITTRTPGHRVAIDVPLDGARRLYLVVTDGGNGYSCDWADWIDPRVTNAAETQSLTTLRWKKASSAWGSVHVGRNAGGGDLRVAGQAIARGIGTHANSVIAFELPEGYDRFVAEGGLDEGGTEQSGGDATSVRFEIYFEEPPPEVLQSTQGSGGLEPREALLDLETGEDLDVTLYAAEPMLLSPSNIDIDEHGRVWAIDVVNYRGHAGKRPEGDRIVVLEDRDGDGVADAKHVFHQGTDIDSALGICLVGDRVLVSASPEVFFLRDTDGDGRADEKTILFTKTGQRQHDHAAHAFVLGPDGRLYGCIGNAGQAIHDRDGNPVTTTDGHVVRDGGKPYWGGIVFRCELDGSQLEVLAHNFRNNYEVAIDAFGRLWQSDNDDDGNRACRIVDVMEGGNFGYLDERTGASWRSERTGMSTSIQERHWHQSDPGVVPNLLVTGAGSPAGITVYEGSLLPPVYRNTLIHADAGPNVVRAYPTRPSGAGFEARIVDVVHARQDRWFRPSDVCVAPDGSLFVADWYDPGVGGHGMGDLARGRIYRVAPPGRRYDVPTFDFANATAAVEALSNANQSVRYRAREALQRLGDPALLQLAKTLQNVTLPAHIRARALWASAEFAPNPRAILERAIDDPDPLLRETTLRVVQRVRHDALPYVERVVDDVDPHVRRAAALALRGRTGRRANELWARLAVHHAKGDRWFLEALGIAADGHWDERLRAWLALAPEAPTTPAGEDIVWRARTKLALPLLVEAFFRADGAGRLRLLRALDFHDESKEKREALLRLLEDQNSLPYVEAIVASLSPQAYANSQPLRIIVNRLVRDARGTSAFLALVERFRLQGQEDEIERLVLEADDDVARRATQFLLRSGQADRLRDALNAEPPERRVTILRRLVQCETREAVPLLVEFLCNGTHERAERELGLQAFTRDVQAQRALLQQVQEGNLPADLTLQVAHLFARSPDRSLRRDASTFLPIPAGRSGEPLPPPDQLATLSGDASSGRGVFEARCAECHQIQGRGTRFGPELTQIGGKLSRRALIESILAPSAAINFGYEGVRLDLEDGRLLTGYVENRTAHSLTLRMAGGTSETIATNTILEETRSTISLMPQDLQKEMTTQEFVDLVEFLTTCR